MPHTATHSPHASSKPAGRLDQLSGDPQAPLFVYGSLRFPEVLRALIGRVPVMVAARADGWRVASLPEAVYPGLVAAEESATGLLITDLTSDDWHVIDAFEDELYDLHQLRLADGRHAWAYVCSPSLVAPADSWDPQYFTEQHLADYVRRCIAWRQRRSNAVGKRAEPEG